MYVKEYPLEFGKHVSQQPSVQGKVGHCEQGEGQIYDMCQIDAPMPLEYVATSLQTSLDALDALGNPILVPGSQECFDFAAASQPPLAEFKFRRTIDRDGSSIIS
ncbi:hypothetical protein EDD22DRAFT_842809 [Suillus occidentalis]|nr:hypothetical protein EDD22DRAFT_842809 [Suillus occidentalis]